MHAHELAGITLLVGFVSMIAWSIRVAILQRDSKTYRKGFHTHLQVKVDPFTGAKEKGKYVFVSSEIFSFERALHKAEDKGFNHLEKIQ